MIRITLSHLSGSRATEIEVVPVGPHAELILRRAASAAVRFGNRVTEPTPVRTGDVLRLGQTGPAMQLSVETLDQLSG